MTCNCTGLSFLLACTTKRHAFTLKGIVVNHQAVCSDCSALCRLGRSSKICKEIELAFHKGAMIDVFFEKQIKPGYVTDFEAASQVLPAEVEMDRQLETHPSREQDESCCMPFVHSSDLG